jgi:hypothetical protein
VYWFCLPMLLIQAVLPCGLLAALHWLVPYQGLGCTLQGLHLQDEPACFLLPIHMRFVGHRKGFLAHVTPYASAPCHTAFTPTPPSPTHPFCWLVPQGAVP